MDIYQFLSSIPWVSTHPWMTTILVPAIFWLGAHIIANIPPPVPGKSNSFWVMLYPILNIVIAANYNHASNASPMQEANTNIFTSTNPDTNVKTILVTTPTHMSTTSIDALPEANTVASITITPTK